MNPKDRVDEAIRCLIRATEALLMPTVERKAEAIVWMGIALVHVANSDPDEKARALAENVIREASL